jgi:hypothetical protein
VKRVAEDEKCGDGNWKTGPEERMFKIEVNARSS